MTGTANHFVYYFLKLVGSLDGIKLVYTFSSMCWECHVITKISKESSLVDGRDLSLYYARTPCKL